MKAEEAGEGTGGGKERGGGRVGRHCVAGRDIWENRDTQVQRTKASKYVIDSMPFFFVLQSKGCYEGGRWLSQRIEITKIYGSIHAQLLT